MRRHRTLLALALALPALALGAAACGGDESAEPAPAPAPAPAEPAPAGPSAPEIVVQGKAVQGGPADIQATKGDTVAFTVSSDEPGEVHVHGYELMRDVAPGAPATLSFEATLDGIYDVELHLADDEVEIARLTVSP